MLYVALDRPDVGGTRALARSLIGHVDGLKLGLEFFIFNGPAGINTISAATNLPIFLDLKLYDIPSTVAAAVRAALFLNPSMITVHAAGGREMLEAAVQVRGNALIIGVTVLTSATDASNVKELAELCLSCGLDGVVCSPHELEMLQHVPLKKVVPGIRNPGDDLYDQRRTMPAAKARALGADILVVGRPITGAASPVDAALRYR